MPNAIRKSLAALFVVSTLSACAGLPWLGGEEPATPEQAATADAPYIDYWQTRDPAEYRRSPAAAGTADRKPIAPSRDVVIAKDKKPAKADRKTDSRVSLTIPVQPGAAVPAEDRRVAPAPGKSGMVAAGQNPAAPPKVQRNRTATSQKGKRKPAGTVASKDLWGRMRGRLVLDEVAHARVDQQIDYLKRNPGYVNLFAQRARPYLHYLVEQIDRRGLPLDLVLVPMVESAFEPTAVSPKEAAGLWQIIPATGQERGLVLAEGYDGRFDIHASTHAALDYLRYLNRLFKGDWLLALAAYNAGPRAVQEAIEAQRKAEAAAQKLAAKKQETPAAPGPATTVTAPASAAPAAPPAAAAESVAAPESPATPQPAAATSPRQPESVAAPGLASPVPPPETMEPPSPFWALKLPKETQDYVPRILALSRIVANPQAYGLQLVPIGNQPYLFRVDVAPEIKIPELLATSGLPPDEFFRFNPGFKPGIEPPVRAYNLLLPWEQARDLVAKVPDTRLVAPSRYTVKKGETLAIIARKHGVPSQALAQWNSLSVNSVLRAGQKLIVYPAS